MQIEQKQNRIYKPQSVYTYAAEECNQVSTELENLIREGDLTPSAGDLTQVKTAVNNIVDTAANNLQEQIDAITSASDVYDVVGTYAELQAYDTTDVPLNDIIKVLQDSTHNDAATYYRLAEVSGNKVWQYVGQEGPYYTKSEIDTDFALKSELPNIATNQQVGLVKPDNSTLIVSQDGTLSATGNVAAALPLFTFVWSIHKINDVSYLLANTFSWQSGNVYTEGYQHLVDDISGITPSTETIGGYTITYYQATDGDKIVLADQETTVQNIYNATGDAKYFILDTTNTRFKLPRWKHNKYQAKAPVIGNGMTLGLTDGTNNYGLANDNTSSNRFSTYLSAYNTNVGNTSPGSYTYKSITYGITTDPTKSGIEATLEEDDMYLYFYVGNFSQSAIEQTAGLNSELFNQKVDKADMTEVQCVVETYSNGTDWYRVWSDGWCEQGGIYDVTTSSPHLITLPKPMYDNSYWASATPAVIAGDATVQVWIRYDLCTSTQLAIQKGWTQNTGKYYWEVKGYIS